MDIEELSKSQIVLLTVLVSFVTSMATGIMTLSLMAKAPPSSVAETVNRIVEQTVEKVDPPVSQSAAAASVAPAAVQEKTVVISESDLVAQAVQKIQPSIVRLYSTDQTSPQFLGIGIVIDKSGTVVTDVAALGQSAEAVVKLEDGTAVTENVVQRDAASGIAYLTPASEPLSKNPTWTPAVLGSTDPGLGSSIFSFYGQTLDRIGEGLLTTTVPAAQGAPETLETDVPSDDIMFGSPLIDTSGEVVGVSTSVSRSSSDTGFVPASAISFSPASSTKETTGTSQ